MKLKEYIDRRIKKSLNEANDTQTEIHNGLLPLIKKTYVGKPWYDEDGTLLGKIVDARFSYDDPMIIFTIKSSDGKTSKQIVSFK